MSQVGKMELCKSGVEVLCDGEKVRKLSPPTPWKGNSSEEVVTLGSWWEKFTALASACSFLTHKLRCLWARLQGQGQGEAS